MTRAEAYKLGFYETGENPTAPKDVSIFCNKAYHLGFYQGLRFRQKPQMHMAAFHAKSCNIGK